MLCIGGCGASDSPATRFDDYLARLARTLDVARPDPPPRSARLYPDKRRLQWPVETPRTGWIGFFQLHRCGLVNLVSERNSILGRVAPAQDRLAYESTLLAGLIACRNRLTGDTARPTEEDREFIARLDELIQIKRQAVPRIFWNRTFGDDAMAHLFSLAGRAPTLTPTATGRESRRALERLAGAGETLAAGAVLQAKTLAIAYRQLEAATYGGQLQQAAIDAATALDAARTMIDSRLARRAVCFNNTPSRRGRTLETILRSVYGPRIQPYLADLVRAGRQWRHTVDHLIAVQRVAPPDVFTQYRRATLNADNGIWAALDTAIARHTRRWQDLLGECGLMPGRSDTNAPPR